MEDALCDAAPTAQNGSSVDPCSIARSCASQDEGVFPYAVLFYCEALPAAPVVAVVFVLAVLAWLSLLFRVLRSTAEVP